MDHPKKTRADLTLYRERYLYGTYSAAERTKLRQLEKRYGHVGFVPFDVEPIKPADEAHFKEWFWGRCKQVKKLRPDIAGAGTQYGVHFDSITSDGHVDYIWEQNRAPEMRELFPEIFDGLDRLPFVRTPPFMIWSSIRTVYPHRDQTCWEDLPTSFRVKLFDENPAETLYLMCDPTENLSRQQLFILPTIKHNVFGWNNLRTKHGSSFNAAYRKGLLIVSPSKLDLERYENLLERSLQRFGRFSMTINRPITDFVDHPASTAAAS